MSTEKKQNKSRKLFWISEALLLFASAILIFAVLGYSTIGLVLLGIAALVALFHVLNLYKVNNPKRAKGLKIFLCCLISLALAVLIVIEIPIISAARTDKEPESPYLIVLGAGVNGTTPSLSLLNRLDAALDYLETYPEAKVIVSGGQGPGEDITEAQCMRSWLEERGISADRIIEEDKATSTEENIGFSLKLLEKDGGDAEGRVAIVSSEYHLYRAKYIAEKQGCTPLAVAGKTSYPILRLNYFIREAAAVAYMWVFS